MYQSLNKSGGAIWETADTAMNVQNAEENSKLIDIDAKTAANMRCAATIDAIIVYIAENVKKIMGKTK
ncbi:hypothetical protein [Bacillus thuringiensis]|uniref:hypothetical protein n=1 Tax=Bacillus thuringiensis TaxID=1428 RepID=UPI0021D68356|nr:hypothetical protein [Bacillus thuringiensis]MCU7667526.1 hypothetical protein [Bacillus thuringiensis]